MQRRTRLWLPDAPPGHQPHPRGTQPVPDQRAARCAQTHAAPALHPHGAHSRERRSIGRNRAQAWLKPTPGSGGDRDEIADDFRIRRRRRGWAQPQSHAAA